LSDAVGAGKLLVAMLQVGDPIPVTVVLAGQVMFGACVSFTCTVKEQVRKFVLLPDASVARHTTVVVPELKNAPLAGPELFVTVTPEQLSEPTGVA
jgi:hypothetical protein